MISKRLQVLSTLLDLLRTVLPDADVVGLDGEETPAARIAPAGRVVLRTGDMGEPEVDLSPPFYWYTHRIPLEVAVNAAPGRTSEERLDDLLQKIEGAILGDPTLGGLCLELDLTAPTTGDIGDLGSARGAELDIVATYGAPTRLT